MKNGRRGSSAQFEQNEVLLQLKAKMEQSDPIAEAAKANGVDRKTYINRRTGQLMDNLKDYIRMLKLPHKLNDRQRVTRVTVYIPGVGSKRVKPLVIEDRLVFLTNFETKPKELLTPEDYVDAEKIFGKKVQITTYSIEKK